MRYFLEISYKGTSYCGWQVQPNGLSIQAIVNQALSTILNEPIHCVGCGRTDAGVHASQFFLHFDADTPLPKLFDVRLNRFLTKDISVKRIIKNLPEKAHTRFDATYRAYDYYIHFHKNPFKNELSWYYNRLPLNFEAMRQAADLLLQYEDFVMFCKTGGSNKTTLCKIFKTELVVDEDGNGIRFHIAANRFLRGMVRRIVGMLIEVGREKVSLEIFKAVMDREAQFPFNPSAPPQGLYLSEVRYNYILSTYPILNIE
ncbi:MAG: tRNA pseudouridine(38-40) synthase TruA [Chitinophagales bacterium]